MSSPHRFYLYCRIAAVAFFLYTAYPVTVKLLEHRLTEDWLHSVLHLCSALFGAYAGWVATGVVPAKLFTWGVGLGYLVLGAYGWFTPGLLLGTHLALPLDPAANLFHLILSLPALLIALEDAGVLSRFTKSGQGDPNRS